MSQTRPSFSKTLIAWYLQNKRDLPWRGTSDPYRVWLSEIILQQTRVAQGLPYYEKFVSAYPSVRDLANASEDEVLKLWQGLGYYSRARNLHAAAKFIAFECNGDFPNTYKELLRLKGVGDYTASAISSICFNEPNAVVDGNVYRVLSRYFGIETPINSSAGVKEFKAMAQELIDAKQPGIFNQAHMEFGARYCVPQNPDCPKCVFAETCVAFRTNKVNKLPVKTKKVKVKTRYFNYVVVLDNSGQTVLQQRTEKGIWHKLYEFPLVESEAWLNPSELKKQEAFRRLTERYQIHSVAAFNDEPIIHKLSHQHLHTRFWIASSRSIEDKAVAISTIESYAVPILIGNFISRFSGFKT